MRKCLFRAALFFSAACLISSCDKQTNQAAVQPQTIELSAPQDQFLYNFLVPEPEGLSIGISRDEALFAGATKAGYADLVQQVERINEVYDAASYKFWTDAVQQRQVATKVAVSCDQPYDIYNAQEQDRFLENFVYFENGKTLLKISEETAVLCGATIEGYRALYDLIIVNDTWGKIVREGHTTYEELRQAFDKKRMSILNSNTVFSELPPEKPIAPPKTYGTIDLSYSMRQGYGSEEIVAALSSNYFCALATLKEQSTGKSCTLFGYSEAVHFTAGLIYPEGGYYSFCINKRFRRL